MDLYSAIVSSNVTIIYNELRLRLFNPFLKIVPKTLIDIVNFSSVIFFSLFLSWLMKLESVIHCCFKIKAIGKSINHESYIRVGIY